MSAWGDETLVAISALEQTSVPVHALNPEMRRALDEFIAQGRQYAHLWRGIIHGERTPPPALRGMGLRREFEQWLHVAKGRARTDQPAFEQLAPDELVQRNDWVGRERVIDRTLGPVSTEQMLANAQEMIARARPKPEGPSADV